MAQADGVIDYASACWVGALTPEACCLPEGVGQPWCFPPDEGFSYDLCCRPYLSTAGHDIEADQEAGHHDPCACDEPFGDAFVQRSWDLNFSDAQDVYVYCSDGLRAGNIMGVAPNTQAFDLRASSANCLAGLALVLAVCALGLRDEDTVAFDYFVASIRFAKMVTHCLDNSHWPLTLAEIAENFLLFVAHPTNFKWLPLGHTAPHVRGVFGETLHVPAPKGSKGIWNHMEVHLRLNWAIGAWDARQYWRDRWDREDSQATMQLAQRREFETIGVCKALEEVLRRRPSGSHSRGQRQLPHPFHVLQVGSGLGAHGHRAQCGTRHGEVVTCDSFARLYRQIALQAGHDPLDGFPSQCDVEELWRYFPDDYFDVAYSSNALDHTVHPLRAFEMMLRALRPGGMILVRNFRNVHPEIWTTLSDGQHQWGFELEDAGGQVCQAFEAGGDGANASAAAASACEAMACGDELGALGPGAERPRFVVWNYAHRWDVTAHLASQGHRVEACLIRNGIMLIVRITKAAPLPEAEPDPPSLGSR